MPTFSDSKREGFSRIFQDFRRRHDHIRRFPKTYEDLRGRPRISEVVPNNKLQFRSPNENDCAPYVPNIFPSKIRDFGESIIIFPFYIEFSFLALVRVNTFLENVSVKAVIAQIFQQAWAIWSLGVSCVRSNFHVPAGVRIGRYNTIVSLWWMRIYTYEAILASLDCAQHQNLTIISITQLFSQRSGFPGG